MKTVAKITTVGRVRRTIGLFVCLMVVMLVASPRQVSGVNLDIPISMTGNVNHTFIKNTVVDIIETQADPFTVDLGTLTSMTSTFEAPGGQRYVVNPPSGVNPFMTLGLEYGCSGCTAGTKEFWPHTITLLNVQGTAPTENSTEASGRVQGVEVDIIANYTVNGPFSFTGFDVSITGPFSSAGSQTYTTSGGLSVRFSNATDTGQFVTVVPEPSTLVLAAIGLLGLTCLDWRRRR